MKKISALLFGALFSFSLIFAQAPPQAFSYKATINKANGQVVASKVISLQVSIIQNNYNGASVYVERFKPLTNILGQIDIQIGRGTPLLGDFSSIDWSADIYFLKVDVDITGGSNYQQLSITQLLSVPYALYAGKSGSATNEADPVFSAHPSYGITNTKITNWNTAFSWGDHAGLYKPLTYIPSWAEITDKPAFANVSTSGSYDDLLNKPVQLTETDIETDIANDVTTSYVPRDNGTKLVTGTIYDNGTNVGIGINTPGQKLDVAGNIQATGTISSNSVNAINGVTASYLTTSGYIYASGNITANGNLVTQGYVASAGNVNAGGNVNGDNFSYNTPQTRYVNIAGGTGTLALPFFKFFWQNSLYDAVFCTSEEINSIFYNVDLPKGATIKGIQIYLYTGAGNTSCYLKTMQPPSSSYLIATVTDNIYGSWHWTPEVSLNYITSELGCIGISCTNDTLGNDFIGVIRIKYEVSHP